ncbi:DEAD/DEAH box helicase [Clostridia bacterium]|nr:DEAD/DEAH box helicase [Clostridia bacterium]
MNEQYNVLSEFHPHTRAWFEETFGGPTETQRQGWPVLAQNRDALIIAPTGTGKTLAAFLLRLDALFRQAERGALPNALETLYITPLKALGNDIALNLEKPLKGIRARFDTARGENAPPLPTIRTAIRHGDTTQHDRASMIKMPPHILITTPESLFLLLTSVNGARMLSTTRTVIVDELHAVLATKRGASLSLSLERLAALCEKPPQRIGLSATLALPEEGAAFLSGANPDGSARSCAIVKPDTTKRAEILVEAPQSFPNEGTVWPAIIRETYKDACGNRSTLVFVNGRAPAEKVAAGLCNLAAEDGEENPTSFARTHHGSLSKERRLEAETLLKSGQLKALCATGSMELGIDVGEIDMVVQIGAPPTVAGGLQRLGRAGHSPDRVSQMRILTRTPLDTLDAALTVVEMQSKRVEPDHPCVLCLDVLAQHCLSAVCTSPETVDALLGMARGAWGYRQLDRDALIRVLKMLSGDYERDDLRMVRPRLYYDAIHETAKGDAYTRMLACAASTIPDRGMFAVWLEDGSARLGELEEEFVFEARIGDRFMLGAFPWQIVRIERDRVLVKATDRNGAQTPFWKGDGIGRAYPVGRQIGERLRTLEESFGSKRGGGPLDLPVDEDGSRVIKQLLHDQFEAIGALAHDRRLIVEHFRTEAGYQAMMVHSPFGGRVHLPLSILLRQTVNNLTGMETLGFTSEYGILLTAVGDGRIPEGLLARIVRERGTDVEALVSTLAALLPPTPLFSLTFRYAAARAMIFGAKGGRRQPLWIQRERGARALDRALAHPEHPLLIEAMRECLTEHMDTAGLSEVLSQLKDGRIETLELHTEKPSPMTADLMFAFTGFEMYDYDPTPAASHTVRLSPDSTILSAVGAAGSLRPPDPAILEAAAPKPKLASPDALHAWLLTGGDARAEELDAPAEWLELLHGDGRTLYVEPGLWIAAEQLAEYDALAERLPRIVERCLRFRGGMSVAQLEDRYACELTSVITKLINNGSIIEYDGVLWHTEVYSLASARTRAALRAAVTTAPPEAYAAWLAARMLPPAGSSRLESALRALAGMAMPLARWEGEVLPARIPRYRPAQLDALLLAGVFVWRAEVDINIDEPLITFIETDAGGVIPKKSRNDATLGMEEQRVVEALSQQGAMFGAALTRALRFETRDALLSLASKGFVGNDSLAPMRALDAAHLRTKTKLLAQAGRWFATVQPESVTDSETESKIDVTLESTLETALNRWGILCRETFALTRANTGSSWSDALDILRVWEYTGRVRRGYFVRGLSGAQFVRDAEFMSITAALGSPRPDWAALPARDPALAWGHILPHADERRFMAVDGTVAVIHGGRIELIAERYGQTLRWWDLGAEPLRALVEAFRAERIYPDKTRLSVSNYPEGGADVLEGAGFKHDGSVYTLWRMEG